MCGSFLARKSSSFQCVLSLRCAHARANWTPGTASSAISYKHRARNSRHDLRDLLAHITAISPAVTLLSLQERDKSDMALKQQCETLRAEGQQAHEKRAAAENRADESARLTQELRTRIEHLEVLRTCGLLISKLRTARNEQHLVCRLRRRSSMRRCASWRLRAPSRRRWAHS